MPTSRPPDWLIYLSAVGALLYTALGRRERVVAPPPPPPLPAAERTLLAQAAPVDPTRLVRVKRRFGDVTGAAFSVADGGVWLTARRVVDRCARVVVLTNDAEGLPAMAGLSPSGEIAVLTTPVGVPALPLAAAAPGVGAPAYVPGFPRGRPGEVAVRFLGRQALDLRTRRTRTARVLAWAEVGRTEGLKGDLAGLFGAPALDSEGRVVGVSLGEAPRRGRIYTSTPDEIAAVLALAKLKSSSQAAGLPITPDNYGLAADDLRRTLRVAPVACIPR
jgi:hypothetical protein